MSPRQSIAHYRITTKLGEGGMGAMYRATDTRLARDVAVKVLPDAFAADSGRLARFAREAQVLASLNHPNIAAIYGVEDRALILELVEAERSRPVAVSKFEDARRTRRWPDVLPGSRAAMFTSHFGSSTYGDATPRRQPSRSRPAGARCRSTEASPLLTSPCRTDAVVSTRLTFLLNFRDEFQRRLP